MRRSSALIVLIPVVLTLVAGWAFAEDPIRWSAPMSAYPHRWAPSQPPPAYYNQYGNQYPYAGTWPGYGQAGYQPQPYGNQNPGWTQQNPQTQPNAQDPQNPQNPQPNYSGNPYVYR